MGNQTTNSSELEAYGSRAFKSRFIGVYPVDRVPSKKMSIGQYAIVNLDKHNEPGTHWIGIVKHNENEYIIYDSFGRKSTKIIPILVKQLGKTNIEDTDYDAEQKVTEYNCGQRVLAAFHLYQKYGKSWLMAL